MRSANRSELIRILVPLQRLPLVEVLGGDLSAYHSRQDKKLSWHLELRLYVASVPHETLVVPFHQCSATLELSPSIVRMPFTEIKLRPPFRHISVPIAITAGSPRREPESLTIDGTSSELIIGGPGEVRLSARAKTDRVGGSMRDSIASVDAGLRPVGFEQTIIVAAHMSWSRSDGASRDDNAGNWKLDRR